MSETAEIDELYSRSIKPLPAADRRRLLTLLAHDLAQAGAGDTPDTRERDRSLLELEGLGAEIWQGIDAQAYLHELRDEWERPS